MSNDGGVTKTPPQSGTKYLVRADGWFIEGTEAELITDCAQGGVLMRGQRRCDNQNEAEVMAHAIGEVYEDEELCAREEFEGLPDWDWPS